MKVVARETNIKVKWPFLCQCFVSIDRISSSKSTYPVSLPYILNTCTMKLFRSLVLPLLCSRPVLADYGDDANTAIKTLQDKWYDTNTGLW